MLISMDEWINQLWCVHTLEFYSGEEKKKESAIDTEQQHTQNSYAE